MHFDIATQCQFFCFFPVSEGGGKTASALKPRGQSRQGGGGIPVLPVETHPDTRPPLPLSARLLSGAAPGQNAPPASLGRLEARGPPAPPPRPVPAGSAEPRGQHPPAARHRRAPPAPTGPEPPAGRGGGEGGDGHVTGAAGAGGRCPSSLARRRAAVLGLRRAGPITVPDGP